MQPDKLFSQEATSNHALPSFKVQRNTENPSSIIQCMSGVDLIKTLVFFLHYHYKPPVMPSILSNVLEVLSFHSLSYIACLHFSLLAALIA